MSVFKKCGVMLDMSRDGVMKVSALKKFIDVLSKIGMNAVYIYLEDTYEIKGYPMFGYMRGRYTIDELREIDNYCVSKGVDFVPCIQTLGHMAQYLRYPQAANVRDTENELLCGAQETYELIEAMIKTMRESISGNKLHIGMDEALELGNGKYYQLHGFEEKSVIFRKHLDRVCEICKKYDFTPMIWDDVARTLIKAENCDDLANALPDVELVPWRYGICKPDPVKPLIDDLKKFERPITFAGGGWTWGTLLPRYNWANATVVTTAKAASENGVENFMLTLWGDDGCQCNYWLAMPQILALAYYNEYGKEGTIEELCKYSEEIGVIDYSICEIANVFDQPKGYDTCVGKRLIWGDICFNSARVFDKEYSEILQEAAKKIQPFIHRRDCNKAFYEYIHICLKTVSLKAYLLTNIRDAYFKKDREFLSEVLEIHLPALRRLYIRLEKKHRELWLDTYKPYGYQKVECRYGSQLMRIKYLSDRLKDYLNGKIDALDEFNEEPLPSENEGNTSFLTENGESIYVDYEKYLCARHLIDVSV